MGFSSFVVEDGRGQRVKVPFPRKRGGMEPAADPKMAAQLVRSLLWLERRSVQLYARIGTAAGGPVLIVLAWMHREGLSVFSWVYFYTGCVFMLLAVIWPRINRKERVRLTRLVRLSCPVCAACGYDMSGLVVEEDGCTVCPECGAAWELECRQSEGSDAVE